MSSLPAPGSTTKPLAFSDASSSLRPKQRTAQLEVGHLVEVERQRSNRQECAPLTSTLTG